MSAWLAHLGPNAGTPEVRPWLEAVAQHFETPIDEIKWWTRPKAPPTDQTPAPTLPVVTLTIFPNAAAARKREVSVAIDVLAQKIAAATAPTKNRLQWLKLARFGDIRKHKDGVPPEKQSLRHNDNVMAIFGVEGDYDDETVSIDDAIAQIRAVGILAIVCASPSHTEDAPRWRVLCPASTELPPDQRTSLLNRLNGALGGILSGESWTLSQSYYYGSVNNNPSHRVEVVQGTPIDLLPALDAGAIGKPAPQSSEPASCGRGERPDTGSGSGSGAATVADKRYEAFRLAVLNTLRLEAVDGQKHFALLRAATMLGGIQAAAGFSDDTASRWLAAALPDTVKDWNAADHTAKSGLARGRQKPITLDDRPPPEPRDPTVPMRDPRRKVMIAALFRALKLRPPPLANTLTQTAHQFNQEQPDPLPGTVVDSIVTWAQRKHAQECGNAQ